jgi:hypothetical protein
MEAAVALQMLLSGQKKRAEQYVEPRIHTITLGLLSLIKESENPALTKVTEQIISIFLWRLMPGGLKICQYLAATFAQVIAHQDESDERVITAKGLLKIIRMLIPVREKALAQFEPVVLKVELKFSFKNAMFNF